MLTLISVIAASMMLTVEAADSRDTVQDTLHTVTVVADKGVVVSRRDVVVIREGENISGVINASAGLTLSDYGSAAGLKGVSLRGLGAANTSVYIDGVRVGNMQNGQPDLGFIDHGSFSSMTVDYAQNSISFNTARPRFDGGGRFKAAFGFMAGSFGTYNPSVRAEYMITDRLSAAANLSWYGTKGDFPYQSSAGKAVRRMNNDLERWRAGADFFGILKGGGWHAKGYFNASGRGIPGSTEWLDNVGRQHDRNGFVQFRLNSGFTPFYDLNITAKAAIDDLDYVYSYNIYDYRQLEFQLNTSHVFHINEWWMASVAAGVQWDGLESTCDDAEYYSASRTGLQGAVSSSFDWKRLDIIIALLYNGWFDDGNAAENAVVAKRNSFSPSMDFRLNIIDGLDVVGFARRAYRVPTFNDLYYPGMGSNSLNPEDSWLTDIGIEYTRQLADTYVLTAKLDAFHYSLTNKITSMPDPSDPTGWTWLMYNIGKVHDNGLDASASFAKISGDIRFNLKLRYSLQDAVDKTTGSPSCGSRIPYVAKHGLSALANLDWRGWKADFNYNLRSGRNDTSGDMPAWNILDLTFSKTFGIHPDRKTSRPFCRLTVLLKASNLSNEHYEIIRYYPLPGRSFTAGIEASF